jgi:hypothetical protein
VLDAIPEKGELGFERVIDGTGIPLGEDNVGGELQAFQVCALGFRCPVASVYLSFSGLLGKPRVNDLAAIAGL